MIWNLVKKVGKQLSQLNAVEDENGILVTDLKLIEEIVHQNLVKSLMAKIRTSFPSRMNK